MPTSYNIHVTSIKHNLNKFYQKLCATKAHLWSHCLSLAGLILLLLIIVSAQEGFVMFICIFMYILIFSLYLYIPFIITFLIEIIFFRNCKIPDNFLFRNPIFHFIWLVGIICSLIPIYTIIITTIVPVIFNFIDSMYYKILSKIILG